MKTHFDSIYDTVIKHYALSTTSPSLDDVEFLLDLEKVFNIEIDDERYINLSSKEFKKYVKSLVIK